MDENVNSGPEWLVAGADVCELTVGTSGGGLILGTTIERVLKRDVVLTNGHRYNRSRLKKDTGGPWDPTTYLLPADDPKVIHARAKNRVRRHKNVARRAADALGRAIGQGDYETARAELAAADAALTALEQVED